MLHYYNMLHVKINQPWYEERTWISQEIIVTHNMLANDVIIQQRPWW